MGRLTLMLCCLIAAICGTVPGALAQSRQAMDCVRFTPNPDATPEQDLGRLENTCDVPIGVIHDFGLNPDGSPRNGEWCIGRIHPEASMMGARLLDPAESIGVGWGLKGRAKKIHWAACTVDTRRNNSVNFILEQPEFRFHPNCAYDCQ